MHLIRQLIAKSNEKKPLLCFLASQILKSRNMHIGLVQRAVSILLYGNGTSKEASMVFNVLKKISLQVFLGVQEFEATKCMLVISANYCFGQFN